MSEEQLADQNGHQREFKPKRVVVDSKSSLLDYELARHKRQYGSIDDSEFIKYIARQHGNIEDLRRRHNQQASYIDAICKELGSRGIEYKVVSRRDYTRRLVNWCDLVISAGGDGTFLTAAKKVRGDTPVIGINTDPVGSEGHLCLTGKARRPADEVVRQFLNNDFQWTCRQRVRVTMVKAGNGNSGSSSPMLINNKTSAGDSSSAESEDDEERLQRELERNSSLPKRTNMSSEFKFDSDGDGDGEEDDGYEPRLALNEVFMGESHAARVSYYELQVDSGPSMKQKSSGMTICTGTGSTSWHYNINRLTEQNLEEILSIFNQLGMHLDREIDNELVEEICRRFNDKLIFHPEALKMSFSIRDPVFNATFPKTISHGFAKRIRLRSRCTRADLILDGSTSIPFNRGAEVVLEIHPEDALRTVHLNS